jgi:hypothetical protein
MSTHVGWPELMLFPACAVPCCRYLVDEDGDACADCRTLWGPYLRRHGEPSPWAPRHRPACGHSWWWFRVGRCDALLSGDPFAGPRCGETRLVDIDDGA